MRETDRIQLIANAVAWAKVGNWCGAMFHLTLLGCTAWQAKNLIALWIRLDTAERKGKDQEFRR